jgi:hypothetical protein
MWTNGTPGIIPGSVKFGFIDNLWSVASNALHESTLCAVAQTILTPVLDEEPDPECLHPWGQLVGKLAICADVQSILVYVESRMSHIPRILEAVWDCVLEAWGSGDVQWDVGAYLLSLPFRSVLSIRLLYKTDCVPDHRKKCMLTRSIGTRHFASRSLIPSMAPPSMISLNLLRRTFSAAIGIRKHSASTYPGHSDCKAGSYPGQSSS